MNQIKFKFDSVTLQKIGKGAIIALTGTLALYILKALGTIDFGSALTPIIAAFIPILVNAIKEWMNGETEF
jgi:hypothetical protein